MIEVNRKTEYLFCWLAMLVDTRPGNLMWYPDHFSDEFVEFAWEAKGEDEIDERRLFRGK
ncbi:MAG: hypothetical protein R3C11_00900 [Planctomycetaceae bacterium]